MFLGLLDEVVSYLFYSKQLTTKVNDGSILTIFPHKVQKEEQGKRLQRRCFPVNFSEFLRTPFLKSNYGGCFWRWARRNQTTAMTSRLNKCYLWMIHFDIWMMCFATGSLALSQNVLAYYSSVVAQWNDFKVFFALSSSFQHTKVLLGKWWQPSNLLEF